MCHMKTASIRELRHQFPSVLQHVSRGETIGITKRGKLIATLTPPPASSRQKRPWMDLEDHIRWLQSQPQSAVTGAELVAEGRGEN